MAPAKKSEPLFRSRRRQESPECTFVVRTPVAWTHTRVAVYSAARSTYVHVRTRTTRGPYMWARLNEIWPDVYFERGAGRCRASPKTHPVHTRFVRTCVRACVPTHAGLGQIRSSRIARALQVASHTISF